MGLAAFLTLRQPSQGALQYGNLGMSVCFGLAHYQNQPDTASRTGPNVLSGTLVSPLSISSIIQSNPHVAAITPSTITQATADSPCFPYTSGGMESESCGAAVPSARC